MRGEGKGSLANKQYTIYAQCTTMCVIHMHICRRANDWWWRVYAIGFGSLFNFLCFPSSPFLLSMNADKMTNTYIYIAVKCVLVDCTNPPFAAVHHLAHMVLGVGRLLERFCLFVLA